MGNCAGSGTKSINKAANYQSVTVKLNCKAANCAENHSSHYCKKCKNQDADHRSYQCTKLLANPDGSLPHCKVINCNQNHTNHYCKMCTNKDSSHFSRECPQTIVLYHGTVENVVQKIKKQGFKESASGCRGKGVYFTDKRQIAVQIAHYRQRQRNGGGGVVFKCAVLNKFKQNQDRGQHAIWTGVTTVPFQQFVTRNPKLISIIEVQKV